HLLGPVVFAVDLAAPGVQVGGRIGVDALGQGGDAAEDGQGFGLVAVHSGVPFGNARRPPPHMPTARGRAARRTGPARIEASARTSNGFGPGSRGTRVWPNEGGQAWSPPARKRWPQQDFSAAGRDVYGVGATG